MSRHLRDLLALLDRTTTTDSYGVEGSDFSVCKICDSENSPGVLAKETWHRSWCPVPRLQKKYARQSYNFQEPQP